MKFYTRKFLGRRNYGYFIVLFTIIATVNAQNYPEQVNLDNVNFNSYQSPSQAFPDYLQPFTENISGNTVMRISDQNVFGTSSQRLRHNYSVDQPWNSDGSLIKLAGYPAAILDGDTYEFLYWSSIPSYGRWSNTQPNIIYGTAGNKFVSHNVQTNQTTTLHTFSGFSSVNFGNGEGTQDNNDKYVGLIGNNNTLIVYDIELDQVVGTKTIPNGDLDWFSVSANGGYAVASWRNNGTGNTQGLKRFNIDLTNETHIYDYTEHGDFGIDANGNEVFVQYGDEDTWDQEYYLIMIRLDNAQVTPLFHWPQSIHGSSGIWGGHVSCRNNARPGWAYISEGCCTSHPVASREIFAIKLDGSNTIERYAKHNSDYSSGYGHESHAVPNRNGTRVLFASNWNNNSVMNDTYPPAWVVEVPQDGTVAPVTAFAGNDVSVCQGESTTLTASGGDNYVWSNGATTQSITVQPNTTTTYTVTVSTGTESDSDDVIVTVNPLPVANAGTNVTICEDDSVTLTATGGNSYQWNNGQTGASITVSPDSTTTYTVTVTQNGCTSQDDVTVTVNPRQTIDAGDDVTIDEGESTTLSVTAMGSISWSNGATGNSITVSPIETTTYTVYATHNGCVSEDSVTVYVNAEDTVTAFAGNDVSICQGESTTLTASGGDNYVWSNGATTQSITVQPSATTTYTVTVSSGTASDSDDVIVTVKPLPIAQVSEDITIEAGMSTTLTASGGNTYEWNTGATSANITVSPTQTTTYSVLAFINGCYDEATVTVTVVAPVNAYAGEDTEICLGEITTLSAQGGLSYLWNTGETTQNIQVSPEETTEYTVTVSNGINSETDSVMVEVDPDCTDLGVGEPGDVTDPFSFIVYPNPTHDIINVKLTGLHSVSSLMLFDVIGKLLINDTIGVSGSETTKQYDLSRYPRGMYLLTLVNEGKSHTKKIILN